MVLFGFFVYWLLWPFRGQKGDKEEEKVGGTNVLNKHKIYTNKNVSTAYISVCPKLSRLSAGRKLVFVVRPTDWTSVAQDFFR